MADWMKGIETTLKELRSGKRAQAGAEEPPKAKPAPTPDEEANKAAKARSDEARRQAEVPANPFGKAKGGSIKRMASGGKVRGGGCEQRGKTRGRFV